MVKTGLRIYIAALAGLLGGLFLMVAPALGDIGYYFHLGYEGLSFSYTKTGAAIPNTVIGQITLTGRTGTTHMAEKWHAGVDGALLSTDDVLVKSVGVSPFAVRMTADVVYLGPNQYVVVSSGNELYGDDASASTAGHSYEASFASTNLGVNWVYSMMGQDIYAFTMGGGLVTRAGQDAILTGSGGSWTYYADSADADWIGLSGAGGQVRTNYDIGSLIEVQFNSLTVSNLDGFFGANRDSQTAKMDLLVVPAPGAIVLGMVGLGLLGVWMRRYA